MQPIEIIVIIIAASFMAAMLGLFVYKRIKHKPIDTCGLGCHDKKKTEKMLAEVRKELALEKENSNIDKNCECNNYK